MKRPPFLAGVFTLALCAAAQAQVETVIVTARFAGPKAEGLIRTTYGRLTPHGKAFVGQQAESIYKGAEEVSVVHGIASDHCAAALGSCGGDDVSALTALILEQALTTYFLDDRRFMESLTKGQREDALAQVKACGENKVCVREALLSSLPPDRRHAVEKILARNRKIRKALDETLASIGLDQKDDR